MKSLGYIFAALIFIFCLALVYFGVKYFSLRESLLENMEVISNSLHTNDSQKFRSYFGVTNQDEMNNLLDYISSRGKLIQCNLRWSEDSYIQIFGEPYAVVKLECNYEKTTAEYELKLINKNNKWAVTSFYILDDL